MLRLINLAKNILASNLQDLSLPYKLTFALTYRCQLKCSICGIWRKADAPELSMDEIESFFRRSPHFSWINLSGGEIFLRQDLPAILRIIDRNCRSLYLLNFPTNGYETKLIAGVIRKFIRSTRIPRIMVTVSVDGPPELHDRLRGQSGAWDRAVETYRLLREMRSKRFEVYMGMTLQDANFNAFSETFSAVQARVAGIHYRDLHVNVSHASSHYYGNMEHPGISEPGRVAGVLEPISRLRRDHVFTPVGFLERRYQKCARKYLLEGKTPVNCEALSSSCFIDPFGMVYSCSIYDCPIDNIREFGFSLGDLWASNKRLDARQQIRQGTCPQCWTPCEAYQSLLANLKPGIGKG
ncbi:MAG: radical SAM protein [Nitrospirae bacterium]|nr:radical SAM protein [Nitrospirota bacterium]